VDAEVACVFLSACASEGIQLQTIAQPTYASGLSGEQESASKGLTHRPATLPGEIIEACTASILI